MQVCKKNQNKSTKNVNPEVAQTQPPKKTETEQQNPKNVAGVCLDFWFAYKSDFGFGLLVLFAYVFKQFLLCLPFVVF